MRTVSSRRQRCPWAGNDQAYLRYHDTEWGVPCRRDRQLFELLVLEGMQAGLSWLTVLKKRAAFRAAFAEFDPSRVARFTSHQTKQLLKDPGIIRNRLKIKAAIQNARAFLKVQQEFGSFAAYLWSFVGGRPVLNHFKTMRQVPARTPLSDALSKDLKQRGFSFVGSTICYTYLQATGVVHDHLVGCFRYGKVY